MPRRGHRYTIFDALEDAGYFDSNPANVSSRDNDGASLYRGPVQYPKMLYHPTGETEVIVPAEVVMKPLGPKLVGEQRQLISKTVGNADDEMELLKLGWHEHPAQAIKAGGGDAPAMGAVDHISKLQSEIARLQSELNKNALGDIARAARDAKTG